MTELSVVCSFRDAAQFLPDLLGSLRRAIVPGTQLVLVDDGSIDTSLDIINRYADDLPCQLDVIETTHPLGPAGGRNAGMRIANGRIIAFVDGDDWVGPGYFSEMIEWIDRLDVDFVRCDHVRVASNRRTVTRAPEARYLQRLNPKSSVRGVDRATMVDYPYSHSGAFHRRLLDSGLLEMPEHLRTAEDRPWIWRLHLEAESYARIASLKYFYRRDVAASLTQVGDERQLDFIPSFEAVLSYVFSDPDFTSFQAKAIRQCLAVVHHHLVNAERLHPGLNDTMRVRLRELLQIIPDDQLAEALATMDRSRGRRIRNIDTRLHAL
jgi:glycosyltransferase involved in cell wall biosynthesis